jgi:hypothetical protein
MKSTTTVIRTRKIAVIAVATLAVFAGSASGQTATYVTAKSGKTPKAKPKAKPKPKPKSAPTTKLTVGPGKPCVTAGSSVQADGQTLECVLWQSSLQWWTPGTRQNPFRLNTVLALTVNENKWEFSVMGRTDDDTARYLAVSPSNSISKPGVIITGVKVRYRNLGGPTPTANTVYFYPNGHSRNRGPIDRWAGGAAPSDDCFKSNVMDEGTESVCVSPYEIAPDELASFRLVVNNISTQQRWYFNTVQDQAPLE